MIKNHFLFVSYKIYRNKNVTSTKFLLDHIYTEKFVEPNNFLFDPKNEKRNIVDPTINCLAQQISIGSYLNRKFRWTKHFTVSVNRKTK